MKLFKKACLILTVMFSTNSNAALLWDNVDILRVQVKANGDILIYFSSVTSEGTCGNKTIGMIKHNNGTESAIYSLALAAYTSKKKVEVYGISECDAVEGFRFIDTLITEN